MAPKEVKEVIDTHKQKYENSCSPSVIEMLLKLEGKAPPDYYELQDKHTNDNVGLDFAREKTIRGLTFHQHDLTKDGPFSDRIKSELKAGKFVGLYALNPGSQTKYHGWIVVGVKNDGQLVMRSKYSENGNGSGLLTVENDSHNLKEAIPPKITDCVYYTLSKDACS